MTATIRPVPRQRGALNDKWRRILLREKEQAEIGQAQYRRLVVEALSQGGSFSWVSEVTGLSTNTLQRWKREAGA